MYFFLSSFLLQLLFLLVCLAVSFLTLLCSLTFTEGSSLYRSWAYDLACERPLWAVHIGCSGSLGHVMLKSQVSVMNSSSSHAVKSTVWVCFEWLGESLSTFWNCEKVVCLWLWHVKSPCLRKMLQSIYRLHGSELPHILNTVTTWE
jgi:hypothetical protein